MGVGWYHRRMVRGTPRYRPDVDGLRAVAVLLVVGRHLRVSWLSGGFVGVDVFFVISGYLISSMIVPEVRAGTFSLVGFYERRVRRIFPALIVMLAVSAGLAWRYLLPTEMVAFARSLVGALFGFSNVVFWSWAGYFDGPNELKPLLHTWSLGVEEQFYLVFPLLLLGTRWMSSEGLRRLIWVVTGVSLGAACWMTWYLPANGFFFAPLRAWELLFGIVVAQGYVPVIQGRVGRNVAGAAGLGMILAAGLLYTARTPFPGVAAIPPCLGAALVIWAEGTWIGWVLGLRPLVFVGLISYSLYLWHWPVQVFWDYAHLLDGRRENDWRGIGWVFSVSMVAAVVSWALVERPVREGWSWGRFAHLRDDKTVAKMGHPLVERRVLRPGRRALFASAGGLAGVALAGAVGLERSGGAPGRFAPEVVRVASFLEYDNHAEDRWGVCAVGPHATEVGALEASRVCLPYRAGERHFLLLGDSHAAQLWPGFAAVFPELDIGQVNVSECPMLVGLAGAPRMCGVVSKFLFEEYLPAHPMEALLVSYRWLDSNLDEVDALVAYAKAHGTRVIVFGPTVEYGVALPRLIAMSRVGGTDVREVAWPRELDGRMARLARERWGVEYVSFFADACGGGVCPVVGADGVPVVFDGNHLTGDGAVRFMRVVKVRGELR
jgi:peptidoglycan/LPS O-acetylase OafA/YrhL